MWQVQSNVFAFRYYNDARLQVYIAFCLQQRVSIGEVLYIPKDRRGEIVISDLPSNIIDWINE